LDPLIKSHTGIATVGFSRVRDSQKVTKIHGVKAEKFEFELDVTLVVST